MAGLRRLRGGRNMPTPPAALNRQAWPVNADSALAGICRSL